MTIITPTTSLSASAPKVPAASAAPQAASTPPAPTSAAEALVEGKERIYTLFDFCPAVHAYT